MTADGFRSALRRYATGVALVTAQDADGPVSLLVNSFTSVSLDPPLVAFCPARTSQSWQRIRRTDRLGIHVLGRHHAGIVRAGGKVAAPPEACLAALDCRVEAEHPAGDHWIAVCRVVALDTPAEAAPLVFWGGELGTFQAAA